MMSLDVQILSVMCLENTQTYMCNCQLSKTHIFSKRE